MPRWALVLALFVGVARAAAGCSGDSAHPPELKPPADGATTTAPKTCGEVRTGQPDGYEISLAGEPAECGAEGLECGLSDVAAFATACDAGAPFARCSHTLKWWILCDADGRPGAPDLDAAAEGGDGDAPDSGPAPSDASDDAPSDASAD